MDRERPDAGVTDSEAMELIQSSGLLNPNFTLEKLMVLTTRLAVPDYDAGDEARARYYTWTFISKHFVYRGTQRN